jgi:hypothetical protein
MVDGYVNQVTVTFQKFSPEMIPTVATVDISMHAIYQGFTRQKSAFTTFIKLQHELDSDDDSSDGDKEPYEGDNNYVNSLLLQGGTGYGAAEGEPSKALFTGFDHSPKHGDDDEDGLKLKEQTMSRFTQNLAEDRMYLERAEVEIDAGITFAPFCYLFDSGLGVVISEQISRVAHDPGKTATEVVGEVASTVSQFDADTFEAHVWTGLQVRARLKALGSSNNGHSDAEAKLAMEVLLDGETGMSGWGEDGEVFFTDWSKGMRSDLLAVGYDNMAKSDAEKTAIRGRFGHPSQGGANGHGQFTSAGPYYTRSFPVLASTVDGNNPQYGDQLYMFSDVASKGAHINWQADTLYSGADKKLNGSPFAHIHGSDGEALRWGMADDDTDLITYNIAKGFWSSAAADTPFNRTLKIYENGSDTICKEFGIQYQINVLYRVKLKHTKTGAAISDTDWLVVHPRKRTAINYVERGKDGRRREANEDAEPLQFAGTVVDRLNLDDPVTDIWIDPANGSYNLSNITLHFDGYANNSDNGVHLWSDSLYQSDRNLHIGGAFFQEGFTDGGLFKKVRTEE